MFFFSLLSQMALDLVFGIVSTAVAIVLGLVQGLRDVVQGLAQIMSALTRVAVSVPVTLVGRLLSEQAQAKVQTGLRQVTCGLRRLALPVIVVIAVLCFRALLVTWCVGYAAWSVFAKLRRRLSSPSIIQMPSVNGRRASVAVGS